MEDWQKEQRRRREEREAFELKNKPELGREYPIGEMNDFICDTLKRGGFTVFYLPTEFVISEPKLVTPIQGRSFSTCYHIDEDGSVVTYSELIYKYGKNFKGTSFFGSVVLTETFWSDGEDGHYHWVPAGYRAEEYGKEGFQTQHFEPQLWREYRS